MLWPLIRNRLDETVLTMGHKCVLRKNMDKYPKIIPITYSYLEDCC